jgi:glucose/arabinose dehydrogenase
MIERMRDLCLGVLLTLVAVAGCGGSAAPPTPGPPGSGGGESITGRERIGWDQQASDAAELATFQYAIYADSARSVLAEVSCSGPATAAGFACSGRLPPLSPGAHTLELAAFVVEDGGVIESARSSSLRVTVVASSAPPTTDDWNSGHVETTADGIALRTEKLISGLSEPIDAAFAPDGRLFIAERSGRVRLVDRDRPEPVDALTLDAEEDDGRDRVLSIAIDPDFARTQFVFIVQTAPSSSGAVFRLARYRELRGRLAERAILLETGSTDAAQAAAVLRFSRDGKLYLALDDRGGTGRLLRLNVDGTMPRDQAGTTPSIAAGIRLPRGMGWDPRSGMLWIADDDGGNAGHLSAVATSGPPVRALVRGRQALGQAAGSLAFYSSDVVPALKHDAFIASPTGRHLLRLRFADRDPTRISSAEPLLQDRVGAIRVVTIGPDGAIYFCTDDALGRLVANP